MRKLIIEYLALSALIYFLIITIHTKYYTPKVEKPSAINHQPITFGIKDNNLFSRYTKPFSNPSIKDSAEIAINQPTAYSYKSKQEIFNIRKQYVASSIFNFIIYKPSEEVFGQIESGKPWISTSICRKKDGTTEVNGPSEESRFLNNPSILVGLDWPFLFYYTLNEDCTNFIMPKKAKYYKNDNLIEVTYKKLPFLDNTYTFNGLNARDLGYKYAYADMSKSENFGPFIESNNISTEITQFKDFIHVGGVCKVPGGCNNASPEQPNLKFKYTDDSQKNIIYIKLWREKPSSYEEKADINEKIIIEPDPIKNQENFPPPPRPK